MLMKNNTLLCLFLEFSSYIDTTKKISCNFSDKTEKSANIVTENSARILLPTTKNNIKSSDNSKHFHLKTPIKLDFKNTALQSSSAQPHF